MYKVGKVFMEEVKVEINDAGQRIVICPICGEEIIIDNELVGDTVWCELCETDLEIVE